MKKGLIAAMALILLGAGCLGGSKLESDWVLGFGEMEGWTLVSAYDDGDDREDFDRELASDSIDAVIQTTDKFIFTDGSPEDTSEFGEFTDSGFTKITIERADVRRNIPKDAEDLGKGFYKVSDTRYFLELPDEKYEFIIETDGDNLEKAEQLILSAERVAPPKE